MLLFGLLINFSLCHASSARLSKEQIIAGIEAPPGEIKYVVSLETPGGSVCSGGIIDDQFILTAAHCVIDDEGNFEERRLTALVGSTKASVGNEGTRVPVETIYALKKYAWVNPNPGIPYSPTADIAVLKLQEKLGLDTNPLLIKVELPTYDLAYVDEETKTAGYGYDSISAYEDPVNHKIVYNGTSTGKLRYATAKVVSNEDCAKSYSHPILSSHLCAVIINSKPAGTGRGDSGGPLVYKDNLAIGVLSFCSPSCLEDMQPSVCTRVAKYTTFIKNAMDGVRTADMRVYTWVTTK